MIDLKEYRTNPGKYHKGAADKGHTIDWELFDQLDERVRTLKQQADELKARRNTFTSEVDELRKAWKPFDHLIEKVKWFKDEIQQLDMQLEQNQKEFDALVLTIPSPAAADVPVGKSDAENVVDEELGTKATFDFTPKPHWELLEAKGFLDQERAVKLSGSRFQIMRGDFALLEIALVQWVVQKLIKKGFDFTLVPQLVREEAMMITGFLPNDAMNLYRVNPNQYGKEINNLVEIKKMIDLLWLKKKKENPNLNIETLTVKDLVDKNLIDKNLLAWFRKYNELWHSDESWDNLELNECTYELIDRRIASFTAYGGQSWEEDDLRLIWTAEVALVAQHAHETFDSAELPRRYVGFSSCYRREAGTYGKDAKGLIRVHQFEKVEMVSFVMPQDSLKEHEFIRQIEEEIFSDLGLAYHRLMICTGDLGAPAAKKYDLEAWFPGIGEYKEVTSTSNTTDFQTRRGQITYKDGNEKGFVHSLNGTAVALGRALACIVETYQTASGDIRIPTVLQPFFGKEII